MVVPRVASGVCPSLLARTVTFFDLPFFPPPLPYRQVYDVLNADKIVVEKGALAYINEWFGGEEQ